MVGRVVVRAGLGQAGGRVPVGHRYHVVGAGHGEPRAPRQRHDGRLRAPLLDQGDVPAVELTADEIEINTKVAEVTFSTKAAQNLFLL